jgi:hypothetical protein
MNNSKNWNKAQKKSSIIFFHGLCGCKSHFDNSSKFFFGYKNLTFDLIGFGKNRLKLNVKKSILSQQIKYIEKKISDSEVENLVLVFHSLATILIPHLFKSIKINKKISHIILIEGDIIEENLQWSKKISNMNKSSYNRYISKFKTNSTFVMKSQLINKKNYKKKYSDCFKNFDSIILRKFCKECVQNIKNNTVYNFLKKIKVKKLLVVSSLNNKFYSKKIKKLFNRTNIIKNSGHYPMIDNPKKTYESIKNFIS